MKIQKIRPQNLLIAIALLVVSNLACTEMAAASDEGYIGREMNMKFSFGSDWDVTSPTPGDYFWVFSQMTFDLYAVNNQCNIDAFMVMERNKKGSVAAYTNSEKNFMDEMNIPAGTGFESWNGRIVGFTATQGPGQKIGMMRSRQGSMGGQIYKNIIYSIVNNGNLLTFVLSAPVESWNTSGCSSSINKLLGTFEIYGEPDPREAGIANYYERTTGINPNQTPIETPQRNTSSSSGSSLSSRDKSNLRELVSLAIEQVENGEDATDTLYDLEELILKVTE